MDKDRCGEAQDPVVDAGGGEVGAGLISNPILLERLTIIGSTTTSNRGINIGSDKISILDCELDNWSVGAQVVIDSVASITLKNNYIHDCDNGIVALWGGVSNLYIYDNILEDILTNAIYIDA